MKEEYQDKPKAMRQNTTDFTELSPGDKDRMAVLYEEVQGRLTEMSLIVARTLKMKLSEHTITMLRPTSARAEQGLGGSSLRKVEVHCTQQPDGHWECGCYDYEAGTCGPC